MDAPAWDERYRAADLVWSALPNVFVEQECAALAPGRALDLAGGEGRNALWLAELGWQVELVDFSAVALDRARTLADERLGSGAGRLGSGAGRLGSGAGRLGSGAGRLECVVADLAEWAPAVQEFDLVLVVYLQVPPALRRKVLCEAAAAVAPAGRLVVVAHHTRNLGEGFGGPRDPAVLYSEQDVAADIAASGLVVRTSGARQRPVAGAPQPAIDVLLVAERELGHGPRRESASRGRT